MSYANTVTLLTMEGGAWPPVTARLWMLWTVLGTGPGTGPLQAEQASDSVSSAASFTFSFGLGPDFSVQSKGIGLSLQDTAGVASDAGFWFRSGRFDGPLPTAPIEVVLLPPIDLVNADFKAALPAVPIAMSVRRTITALSASPLKTSIVLGAAGTTNETGVPVKFSLTLEVELLPGSNIRDPETGVFAVGFAHPALIQFTASDPLGSVAASTLNASPAVRASYTDFIVHSILPGFLSRIESRFTTLVLASLSGLIGPGTTALPPGIVLSVRTVEEANPNYGLTVRAALGAFGGVFSKLPAAPPISTGKCFIAAAATSESSSEVVALRQFRDAYLLRNATGTRLVKLYERLSPPLAARVRRHRTLRGAVRWLLVKPAVALARLVSTRP